MLLVDVCASWLLYVELAVMIYLPSQRHSMIDSSVLIPEPVTVLLIISHFTKYRNTLYVDVWPVMYDVMCSVATGVTCAGGSGGAVMSCYNCGKPGHMSRDCTEMRMSSSGGGGSGSTCYNCGESGHFSRECPNRMSSDERMDTRKCYNCNETGHLSRDCPDANRRSSDRSAVECFRCPPCVFLRNYWSLVTLMSATHAQETCAIVTVSFASKMIIVIVDAAAASERSHTNVFLNKVYWDITSVSSFLHFILKPLSKLNRYVTKTTEK